MLVLCLQHRERPVGSISGSWRRRSVGVSVVDLLGELRSDVVVHLVSTGCELTATMRRAL